MRVFIPADSAEPIDLDVTLESLLDGIRLTELETLDDLLSSDEMDLLLDGQMTLKLLRPVLYLRLRREYPDLDPAGFDVEIIPEGAEEDPAAGKG